jgi:Cdc6-like AAA superfamily ATPase
LFCTGIPGAGKTILTSIVIDDLLAKFENDESVGIAFLYCNFRRHHEQSADDLLVNLLKQLSERKPSVPESVKTLYYGHKEKRTGHLFDEVLKTLASTCDQYERVFFVVDALDECPGPAALLKELFLLQSKCQANIFCHVSSYP